MHIPGKPAARLTRHLKLTTRQRFPSFLYFERDPRGPPPKGCWGDIAALKDCLPARGRVAHRIMSKPLWDTTLVHVATSVNHKGLSREKITFIAGKKKQGPNQILGLLEPAQRSQAHVIF
jgi:hypothetical protein